jgi:hypothetical protein
VRRRRACEKLRDSIEKWAGGIGEVNPDELPSKVFEIDDWKIEIILFGGFSAEVESKHAIATAMGDLRVVKAEKEIRQALSTKGKRYGALNVPYLIVIADCKEELVGGKHNDDALIEPESWKMAGTKLRTCGSTMDIGAIRPRREA